MALASENNLAGPQTWKGQSGRTYRLKPGAETVRGNKATVRPVLASGAPVGRSDVPDGAELALKLPWKGNPEAPDALDAEGQLLDLLTRNSSRPPSPRLVDTVVAPAPPGVRPRINGLVLEWCPENLETWWLRKLGEPDAFPALCLALADVCELVRDYQTLLVQHWTAPGPRPNARLKPRNIARGPDGRWLLTDFEELKVKGLYDEHLSATQPLLGGENFLPPEVLFDAKRSSPTAMDTWAVGCMLYALLRVKPYVSAGAALPADGTNSPHFRTHRVHLVTDLRTRKPTLLVGKDVDPSRFLFPDRLPDQDRRAVLQSIECAFGERDEDREVALAAEVVRLLDRALRIEPARRFVDPMEMARELRSLANRFHRILKDGVRSEDDLLDEKTMLLSEDALRAELEPAAEAPSSPPAPEPPAAAPPASGAAAPPSGPAPAAPPSAPAPAAPPSGPAPAAPPSGPAPSVAAVPPVAAPAPPPSRPTPPPAASTPVAPPRSPAPAAMPPMPPLVSAPPVVPGPRAAAPDETRTQPAAPAASTAQRTPPQPAASPVPAIAALEARIAAQEQRMKALVQQLQEPPAARPLPTWVTLTLGALLISQIVTWVALTALVLSR